MVSASMVSVTVPISLRVLTVNTSIIKYITRGLGYRHQLAGGGGGGLPNSLDYVLLGAHECGAAALSVTTWAERQSPARGRPAR